VILDQWSKVLTAHGVRHGIRAAGHKPDPTAHIQLGMLQTEWQRCFKTGRSKLMEGVDRLHIDELHANTGSACTAIYNAYGLMGASLIGYSASPSGLAGIVDDVYQVVSVRELIAEGYLTPPLLFSCGAFDAETVSRLKRDAAGEYQAGELDKLVKKHRHVIIGNVLEHRRRLCPDNRAFALFAHNVKASIWWAQMLTAKGVPTAHIDCNDVWLDGKFYKSDSAKRQECFDRLANGSLEGISNRFVLREGWDCSAVGNIIVTHPVALRRTWVQICGRGLRPYPNRQNAIIQDHGGSVHPPLDSDEPWDWQGESGVAERVRVMAMREDREPEPITCPQCCNQRYAGDTCPYCGFRYAKHARYVYQANGTLKLVEGKLFRPRRITRSVKDAQIWSKLYWSTVKNSKRTAEQAYTYYAVQNHWRWLPRNLPLMPKNQADWFRPLKSVPQKDLIKA